MRTPCRAWPTIRAPFRRGRLRRAKQLAFFALAIAGAGCGELRRLKERLRQQEGPGAEASQDGSSRSDRSAHGTLEVNVSPPEGIAIALDGRKVAIRSPFRAAGLAVGVHTLEVRAMGHYPVTLPIALAAGETLRMPVSLRPRAPRPLHAPPAQMRPQPQPPLRREARPQTVVKAPLPLDMTPAQLTISTRPEQPLRVDDEAASAEHVILPNRTGVVQLGTIALRYVQLVGHAVEFIIPADGAAWFVGGRQVKASSHIRLDRLPVYLTRQIGGYEQRITVELHL